MITVGCNNQTVNSNNENGSNELATMRRSETVSVRKSEWLEDIEVLTETLKSTHRGLYDNISETTFNAEVELLENRIDYLNDHQITIEIMRLIARVGDGHTYVEYFDFLGDKVLPLKFAYVEEKLVCVNATQEYDELLFSRITSINGHPTNEVYDELMSLVSSENDYWREYESLKLARLTSLYEYLDLAPNNNQVEIAYENDNSSGNLIVKAKNLDEVEELDYVIKSRINNVTSTLDFLYQNPYWYEYDEHNKILKLNYDQCMDFDSTFKEFNTEFWNFVDDNDVNKIVVDMRFNTGGNDQLFDPFRRSLLKHKEFNDPQKLYVIIGNRTFSSAVTTAVKMKKLTNALLIGEPTGNSPNHYSDPRGKTYITLPNSEITFRCTNTYFETYPGYEHDFLMPDVTVEDRIEDYIYGIDSCYQYVVNQN